MTIATLLALIVMSGCATVDIDDGSPVFLVNKVDSAETIYDRARFRASRKDGRQVMQLTLANESRLPLVPPLDSRFTFRVRVPSENPILEFAIAVDTLGSVALRNFVAFRVTVSSQGNEQVIRIATLLSSRSDGDFVMTEEQFYDLSRDPRELHNLAGTLDAGLGTYRSKLRSYLAEVAHARPALRGEPVEFSDELREKLRSLGYSVR